MIFCNGCPKSGTHLLTELCKAAGVQQVGGTVALRDPAKSLSCTGVTPINTILALDDDHFAHAHIAYRPDLVAPLQRRNKHIFITRHPRNVAVSWMRHRHRQDPSIELSSETLGALIAGGMFGVAVPVFISRFVPWVDEAACVVRYEDVERLGHSALARVREYLGLPEPVERSSYWGRGGTANATLSQWQEYWTDDIEAAWEELGGPLVARQLGYSDES